MSASADLTTTKQLFDILKRMYDPADVAKNERPLRYVIYARKSTDDSDKQTRSLGDQMSECLDYVEKHNLLLRSAHPHTRSGECQSERQARRLPQDDRGHQEGPVRRHYRVAS